MDVGKVNVQTNASFWEHKGVIDYVDEWFLMGTPYPMLVIVASYLLFVLKLGPQYMKHRPAYKLKNVILLYNVFQVSFSAYIFYLGSEMLFKFGFVETTCLLDIEDVKRKLAIGAYYYSMAKFTELLDTVFFVLRKKWNQVSFLHVYHHTLMVGISWIVLKYQPTYTLVTIGTLNSFVHVPMYAYYALSAFPKLTDYLWWKKYITKLQLIQFFIVLITANVNFFSTKCSPSYAIVIITWTQLLLFIYLFSDFYIKQYKSGDATNGTAKKTQIINKHAIDHKNGSANRQTNEHLNYANKRTKGL